MKSKRTFLSVLTAALLLFGCADKIALFPPIVQGAELTSNTQPEFTWKASVGNASYYLVELINQGTSQRVGQIERVEAKEVNKWKAPQKLANGTYILKVTAYRPADKKKAPDVASKTVAYVFTVDVQAAAGKPVITDINGITLQWDESGAQNSIIIASTTPFFRWTEGLDAETYLVTLYSVDGASKKACFDSLSLSANTRFYQVPESAHLKDGSYVFEVNGITSMGVKGEASVCEFEINTQGGAMPDITEPKVPEEGGNYMTNADSIIFTWRSEPLPSGEIRVHSWQRKKLKDGETTAEPDADGWGIVPSNDNSGRALTVTVRGLTDGRYIFFVRSQDQLGNWSAPASRVFEIDMNPPAIPVVTANTYTVTSNEVTNVTFTWEVSEDTDHLLISSHYKEGNTIPEAHKEAKDAGFVQEFDPDTFEPEDLNTIWLYTFSAVDKAGNRSDTITVRILYNPVIVVIPSFMPWKGSIEVTQDGKKKYYSREVELVWGWRSAPGVKSENYKIAFVFQTEEDYNKGVKVPEESAYFPLYASSWSELTDGDNRGDGHYTLYLKQEIEAGIWSTPISREYIIARNFVPEAPKNVIGSKKVGAFDDGYGNKFAYPSWSWSTPDRFINLVAYEYHYAKEGSADGTWIRTDDTSTRSIAAVSGLEVGKYTFYVRSVNILGNVSPAATFETEVVNGDEMPKAPVITPDASIVGGKDYAIHWNWSYPDGKKADKVWAKTGAEPTDQDQVYTSGTSYSMAYDAALEGKETDITLYVMAHYEGDEDGIYSLVGQSTVTVDLNPPVVPQINGTAELPEESELVWLLNHSSLKDVAKYRYQAVRKGTALADNGWTEVDSAPSVQVNYEDATTNGDTIVLHAKAADRFGNWSDAATFETTIKEAKEPPNVIIPAYAANNYLNASMKTTAVNVESTNGDVTALRYRFTHGSSAWKIARFTSPAANQSFNFKTNDLTDGENVAMEYQAQINGEWSKTGRFELALIDVNPPAKPSVSLQGGDSKTGDTTPRIEWRAVNGVSSYKWTRNGETTETTDNYFIIKDPLTNGKYTVSVSAVDRAQNESDATILNFEIDSSYRDYSRPEVIQAIASKYLVKDYVRVSWKPESKSVKYAIYQIDPSKIDSAIEVPTAFAVDFDKLTTEKLEAGDPEIGCGKNADGSYYAYVYVGTKTAYYGVIGQNDEDKIGFHLLTYTAAAKNNALGISLMPVYDVAVTSNKTTLNATWKSYLANAEYRVLRSKQAYPYGKSPTGLPITDFNVFNGSAWVAATSEEDILKGRVFGATSFSGDTLSTIDDYVGKEFIYRVYAISKEVRDNQEFYKSQFSGLSEHFYLGSPTEGKLKVLLPDPDKFFELAATQGTETGDNKLFGKIKLTVSENEKGAKQDHSLFTIKAERTYRYGGTHQGYPTNDLAGEYFWNNTDKPGSVIKGTYCTDLYNPNPASCPWEKTVLLEYSFDLASSNSANVYDTLYDTDDATGEKLLAVRRKVIAEEGFPWFERKESIVKANASKYDIIYDPDGTASEYEWHYLNWDWVMRKYMYHASNPLAKTYPNTGTAGSSKYVGDRPGRFDLKDAVRCDYRLVLVSKLEPNVSIKSEKTVSGYPSLTPREFSSLAMILREIAFYEIEASYYDEITETTISNQPPKDPKTAAGWANTKKGNGGSIELVKGELNGFTGIRAHVRTNGPGYEYFSGCFLKFDWPTLGLNFGGPSKCIDNFKLEIQTPLAGMSGTVNMTAFMMGGTYFHGMHSGSFVTVTYPGYSGFRMEIGENWGKGNNHKVLVSNEYLEMNWGRISTSTKDTYMDRYTSINWSYGNKQYPGF